MRVRGLEAPRWGPAPPTGDAIWTWTGERVRLRGLEAPRWGLAPPTGDAIWTWTGERGGGVRR